MPNVVVIQFRVSWETAAETASEKATAGSVAGCNGFPAAVQPPRLSSLEFQPREQPWVNTAAGSAAGPNPTQTGPVHTEPVLLFVGL